MLLRFPFPLFLAPALLLLLACEARPPAPAAATPLSGAAAFAACQSCHSLAPGAPHKLGPNLYGIAGARAASQPGYHYSPALKNSTIIWDKPHLIAWIIDPESLAPGTWMVYHNPLTPTEAARLADLLLP